MPSTRRQAPRRGGFSLHLQSHCLMAAGETGTCQWKVPAEPEVGEEKDTGQVCLMDWAEPAASDGDVLNREKASLLEEMDQEFSVGTGGGQGWAEVAWPARSLASPTQPPHEAPINSFQEGYALVRTEMFYWGKTVCWWMRSWWKWSGYTMEQQKRKAEYLPPREEENLHDLAQKNPSVSCSNAARSAHARPLDQSKSAHSRWEQELQEIKSNHSFRLIYWAT